MSDDQEAHTLFTIRVPLAGSCYIIPDGNKSGYPASKPSILTNDTLPPIQKKGTYTPDDVKLALRAFDAALGSLALYLHNLDAAVNGYTDVATSTTFYVDRTLTGM